MGKRGAKLGEDAREAADSLVEALRPLGPVSGRAMFGGVGVFCDGVMFAIVDPAGDVFLRVDEDLRAELAAAGGRPHGRMPYVSLGPELQDVLAPASRALAIARAAKR